MFLVLGDDDDDQIGWANFSGKLCRQRCSKVNVFFYENLWKTANRQKKIKPKTPNEKNKLNKMNANKSTYKFMKQ